VRGRVRPRSEKPCPERLRGCSLVSMSTSPSPASVNGDRPLRGRGLVGAGQLARRRSQAERAAVVVFWAAFPLIGLVWLVNGWTPAAGLWLLPGVLVAWAKPSRRSEWAYRLVSLLLVGTLIGGSGALVVLLVQARNGS
jgi:hypothetical protein